MFRRAFLLAVVPTLVWAAPPPTARRISVLLVPMDRGAEAQQVKLERYITDALAEFQGLTVKPTSDLFGLPPDDEAEASFKRAETGFKESKDAFDGKNFEDAERKLRATIKEYGRAAAAIHKCAHLCDAVAMYAASLQARGDLEEAKIALLDLLALGPTYELDRKKFPQEFISLRTQVATSRNAQLRGNVNVKSKPAGAAVLLDGDLMGYTPMSLQTLAVGKHVVRLERPGFKQWGAVVEVTPEDSELTPELVATPGYKAYDTVMDKLAAESAKDKGGQTMTSLGKSLGIDRAIVGVVKELDDSGKTELSLSVFDLRSGARQANKRSTFQGDEFGQLKSELGRVVNQLMITAEGGGETVSKGGDPLKGKHGTEDWNEEDKGGSRTQKEKKKKKGDPLDGVNGTEDW
ncbi:MAG: PEGA domain-containing protein [Myxococcaceae bacterium]|nr:PEGA domain-containing protein [Myxococcaceae bacterium]